MSDEKSFKSRVSDVFGCLDKVDFKSDSSLKQDDSKAKLEQLDDEGFRRPRSPVRSSPGGGSREPSRSFDRFKKTDSIFQETPDVGSWKQRDNRPIPRPGQERSGSNSQGRNRSRPKNPLYDHRRPQRKDPSKYTKYSLADVDDVTDRSNTMAALDFINSRKRSSDAADDDQSDEASLSKVVFKKPSKKINSNTENGSSEDKETQSNYGLGCGNSKRVMPEAVVGRQATKKKAPTAEESDQKQKSKRSKQKKLSHLDFEDEDVD